MSRDIIVNLVAKSGSGKTTVAKELEKLGYNVIQSYTTRKPRHKEEWGHTFINTADMEKINKDDMIAFKEVYKGLYYFATKEQYQGKGVSIYTVCPDGAKQVKENVKDAEVITIYLQVDENIREFRMRDEGRSPTLISDRLENDRKVFEVCECDYVIDGSKSLSDVVGLVNSIVNNI